MKSTNKKAMTTMTKTTTAEADETLTGAVTKLGAISSSLLRLAIGAAAAAAAAVATTRMEIAQPEEDDEEVGAGAASDSTHAGANHLTFIFLPSTCVVIKAQTNHRDPAAARFYETKPGFKGHSGPYEGDFGAEIGHFWDDFGPFLGRSGSFWVT